MERVTGIEPASPAWKAGALAIVLHPRAPSEQIVSFVILTRRRLFVNRIFRFFQKNFFSEDHERHAARFLNGIDAGVGRMAVSIPLARAREGKLGLQDVQQLTID